MKKTRTAFTLMEMMVVIGLLVTLMGIGMTGIRRAENYGREHSTRLTIMKLNQFVMEKYASYQYRYISGSNKAQRLRNLYESMCHEMPDHWIEVGTDSPPVFRRAKNLVNGTGENQSAELLYLLVMSMPDAESAFTAMEIGDTDNNGLKEFVDSWGEPIWFLRWPAGHCDGTYGAISKIQNGVDPNPFDPTDNAGYAVFPLIYSSGPDKVRSIVMAQNSVTPWGNGNTGAPGEGNADGSDSTKESSGYYDNITNHNL